MCITLELSERCHEIMRENMSYKCTGDKEKFLLLKPQGWNPSSAL